MHPATPHTPPPGALVVEHDPVMRRQLVTALSRKGFAVAVCDTLGQGRERFARQPLVVTHANGDTAELRGFVRHVRTVAGERQPYILAVGDAGSPSGLVAGELGLNEFLATPVDSEKLDVRLTEASRWLAGGVNRGSVNGAAPAMVANGPARLENGGNGHAATVRPAPRASAVLAHFAPVLLDHVSQAVALFDREMRYLVANDRFVREFGLAGKPFIGRSHYELFPDLHETWRRLFDSALAGKAGRIDEDMFRRPDGSTDWVRWEIKPWHAEDGTVGGVVLSQEVITELKRAERSTKFEANLAATLFDSTVTPVLLVGLDGVIRRSSAAARSLFGLQPTADGRMPFWEIYPTPETEDAVRTAFHRALAEVPAGQAPAFAPPVVGGFAGNTREVRWAVSPHKNSTGAVGGLLLVGVEMSTAAPVSSPAPVAPPPARPVAPAPAPAASVADHLPFGVCVLGRDGEVLSENASLRTLLGFALADAADFEGWLERGCAEETQREVLLREWRENIWRRQLTRTFSLLTDDGLLKEIEFRPRLLPQGHLLLTLTDVTESRRSEDALRATEAKFRALFHENPTGIALVDRTGSLVDANAALEKLIGATRVELRRSRLSDIAQPAADGQPARLLPRQGEPIAAELCGLPIRNSSGEAVLTAWLLQPLPEPPAAPAPAAPAAPAEEKPSPDAPSPSATVESPAEPAAEPNPWPVMAFDGLRTAMIVTDLRGRIRDLNPAAEQFFGYDAHDLVDTGIYRLFRPETPAAFSREVSEGINRHRRWHGETEFTRADGSTGRCRAEIFPVQHDTLTGLLCIVQPIFMAAR